jgi:chromate transporter
MVLLKLFFAFLKIGFFAIGGAYSFLPLTEKEVVQNHHWLEKSEFLEVVGMAEVFPGAISIKFATYTGYRVAGVPGVIVANVANLLPPALLMIVAATAYARFKNVPFVKGALKMVRYAVVAMLIAIAVRMVDARSFLQLKYVLVVIVSFLLLSFARVHPAIVIVLAALYGGLLR